MKVCSKCNKERPDSWYYKNGTTIEGVVRFHTHCKECQKDRWHKNYCTTKNRIRQQLRIKRTRATRVVQQAKKDGRLVPEPCWVCGATKVHAHHLLYDFPLKVIWLCSQHHADTHREMRYE